MSGIRINELNTSAKIFSKWIFFKPCYVMFIRNTSET